MPQAGLMPSLTAEEVARFAALDERARAALNAGDLVTAEAASRAQLSIFAANAEPWLRLAMVDAGRGEREAALDNLEQAVVRGFLDMARLERAEAWVDMQGEARFRRLQQAVHELAKKERDWPAWDGFRVPHQPESVAAIMDGRERLIAEVEALAPALGARLTELWRRMLDRATAAMLATYAGENPEADDTHGGLEQLLALYAGGPLRAWGRIPQAAAVELARVSEKILAADPDSAFRPIALVSLAASHDLVRDRRGRLDPAAATTIRGLLHEVLTDHGAAPVADAAIVGLVRTAAETGEREAAERAYRDYRERHASEPDRLATVQRELGPLALELAGLPLFTATTLDGRAIDVAALAGKVTVVDFWATWCAPCLDELPSLRRIAERHGDDVVLLGINLDDGETLPPEELRQWIATRQMPGQHVQDGHGWDSALVAAFGVQEIPFNVVVSAAGDVVAVSRHGKELERAVQSTLAGTARRGE